MKTELDPSEHAALTNIVRHFYCPETVVKPDGQVRFGFFNFKRMYGYPEYFQNLLNIIARFVNDEAVCAPDAGISPLVGALAIQKRMPSLYVRRSPKQYYLSYGSQIAQNQPHLVGESLKSGTRIQLIDDVINKGDTIVNAVSVLEEAGLSVASVLCIMNVKSNDRAIERVRQAGVQNVTVLLRAGDVLTGWNLGTRTPKS